MALLDVGCGPGSITVDLAHRVAPGRVAAVDASAEVIELARAAAGSAGLENLSFEVGDGYALDHEGASFDVVHAHQVVQHLSEPVRALVEMRRVLKPDGLLAVRDGDYGGFFWSPADEMLDRWLVLYHELTAANRTEADAGRHLPAWVRAAGFGSVEVSSSTWTFAAPEDRAFWGGLWADRVVESEFARQSVEYGLSTPDELAAIADAFTRWTEDDDGVFVTVHVEVLARP